MLALKLGQADGTSSVLPSAGGSQTPGLLCWWQVYHCQRAPFLCQLRSDLRKDKQGSS